jgi:predicted phosphoribosyltransferase
MYLNREDAARQLADKLRGRELYDPLILAIPRGGVVTGVILAHELGAELDVVLARKLRWPWNPELAIGAVSEDGRSYLNPLAHELPEGMEGYLADERSYQLAEIARRKKMFRTARPQADMEGRSVIVTDDGIATGSTMIAALQTVREHYPREIIVAVPVIARDRVAEVRKWCDELVYLQSPEELRSVGEFYRDFTPVEDLTAVDLLRDAAFARTP